METLLLPDENSWKNFTLNNHKLIGKLSYYPFHTPPSNYPCIICYYVEEQEGCYFGSLHYELIYPESFQNQESVGEV